MKKAPTKLMKKSPAKKVSAGSVRMAEAILGEEKSVMKMKKAAMKLKKDGVMMMKKAAMKMKKATAMKMKMKKK